eukprot:5723574-Prymnesium_polylepis.1
MRVWFHYRPCGSTSAGGSTSAWDPARVVRASRLARVPCRAALKAGLACLGGRRLTPVSRMP